MANVLPDPPGLEINTVLYNYTIRKNTEDHVDVFVQNERADGNGYIFREHDEWRPGSLDGTEINKVVAVGSIPRQLWGDGSIDVRGPGKVEDASLVYTYKVDPCFNPQFDPNCPGYKKPEPVFIEVDLDSLYDVLNDENVQLTREACVEGSLLSECESVLGEDKEEEKTEEELAEEEAEEKKDREMRLEQALSAADNSALFAQALAQSVILQSVNSATNINTYYNTIIPGGAYRETIVLSDRRLPENRQGLRNGLAQQILHNEMIEMQYRD